MRQRYIADRSVSRRPQFREQQPSCATSRKCTCTFLPAMEHEVGRVNECVAWRLHSQICAHLQPCCKFIYCVTLAHLRDISRYATFHTRQIRNGARFLSKGFILFKSRPFCKLFLVLLSQDLKIVLTFIIAMLLFALLHIPLAFS